jgi:sialate O-acetylesterase
MNLICGSPAWWLPECGGPSGTSSPSAMLRASLLALSSTLGAAKISQNRLYSDDMILESREAYDIRPFIAGFGDKPGEKVQVTFARGTYPTTVGTDGKWEVQMNCCDKLVNQTLVVSGQSNTLTYSNVACGQVFVCSGQSNMELPLSYVLGGAQEIANASRPNWRLFRVPHTPASTPQDDMEALDAQTKLPATWLVSTPEVAARFSAVCYLSAKHVAEMWWGDAPIGLIWSAWGGTRVEAWAPTAAKTTCPSSAADEGSGPQTYSALYNGMIVSPAQRACACCVSRLPLRPALLLLITPPRSRRGSTPSPATASGALSGFKASTT